MPLCPAWETQQECAEILQPCYHFNWKTLSAMAGVTWWNFHFRLFPGSIRSPQVVEFLSHLLRHIPGKLLIIWANLCRAYGAVSFRAGLHGYPRGVHRYPN